MGRAINNQIETPLTMPQVIQATEAHCAELAPKLREVDVREIAATNPTLTPLEVLRKSVEVSEAFAVVDSEGCLAVFGLRNLGNRVGVPWMLCSDRFFEKHSRKFIKQCKYYVNYMASGYRYLFNQISVENLVCQRWLTWLGFTIHTDEVLDINGTPFYKFDVGHIHV